MTFSVVLSFLRLRYVDYYSSKRFRTDFQFSFRAITKTTAPAQRSFKEVLLRLCLIFLGCATKGYFFFRVPCYMSGECFNAPKVTLAHKPNLEFKTRFRVI